MTPIEAAHRSLQAARHARVQQQIEDETQHLLAAMQALIVHVLQRPPDPGGFSVAQVRQAHARCSDDDVGYGMAETALRLGKALFDLGQPEAAVDWLEAGHGMMSRYGGEDIDLCLGRFGVTRAATLRQLHRYDEAEQCLDDAQARLPAAATVDVAALVIARATLYQETDRREEAVQLLEELLRRGDAGQPPQLTGYLLANLAMQGDMFAGRHAQAMDRLMRARVLLDRPDGDPRRLARIEQSLALVAVKAGDDHAMSYACAAIARNAADPEPDVTWRCLEAAAAAAMASGHEALATLLYKWTIDVLQVLRQRRIGRDDDMARMAVWQPAGTFDLLARILARQGRLGEAREVMRLKVGAIVEDQEPAAPGLTASEESALQRLKQAIDAQAGRYDPSALMRVLADISRGLKDRQAQLAREAAALNDRLRLRSLDELPPGAAARTLRLHVIQDETTLTLVASVDGVELLPAGAGVAMPVRDLNELVSRFVVALMRRDLAQQRQAGARLYELLLAPVLAGLPDTVHRLLVSAPGPLHNLPWAALPYEGGFLVERLDIVRLTVPAVDLRRPPRPPLRLLACGCSAPGHAPLPQAAVEVRGLAAQAVLDTPERYTRAGLAALLPQASVLHVASHFRAEPVDVKQSRLLLGDGSEITLADLAGLGLGHLDLLVLSTCESGVAGGPHGAADFAVDHLLQASAVPAVVGTLFPVHDAATAELMQRFHDRLRAGDDKDRALATAQRQLIAGAAGPDKREATCWAAPMLSGNWLGWARGSSGS